MAEDSKSYVGLKLSEMKLKLTDGISKALGQIVACLLIVAVLNIFLGVLAYVLISILDKVVGAPWGAVIVCSLFLVTLVVLLACRKRLFRGMFIRILLDDEYPDVNTSGDLEKKIDGVRNRIERRKSSYSYANMALKVIGFLKATRSSK